MTSSKSAWKPPFDLETAPKFTLRAGIKGWVHPNVGLTEANAIVGDAQFVLQWVPWEELCEVSDVLVLIVPQAAMAGAAGRALHDHAAHARWIQLSDDLAGRVSAYGTIAHEFAHHAAGPGAGERKAWELALRWLEGSGSPYNTAQLQLERAVLEGRA
jgi:hypothetical protein